MKAIRRLGWIFGALCLILSITFPQEIRNIIKEHSPFKIINVPLHNYLDYKNRNADTSCLKLKYENKISLCLQLKESNAAAESATIAVEALDIATVGAVFSLIGMIGLLFALRQTDKSLKIAKDTAESARKAAQLQLSAYVGFVEVKLNLRENSIWIYIQNYGQTRATQVLVWTKRYNHRVFLRSPIETLEPGQVIPVLNKGDASIRNIRRLQNRPVITVKIEFQTIYDNKRHERITEFYFPGAKEQQLERDRNWIALYHNGVTSETSMPDESLIITS